MVRPYNERAAWEQERAELAEQIAAVQRDLDATRSTTCPAAGGSRGRSGAGQKRLAEIDARLGRDRP